MEPPGVPYAIRDTHLRNERVDAAVAVRDRDTLIAIVDCVLSSRRILLDSAALAEHRIASIRVVRLCTCYLGALGIAVWGRSIDDSGLRLVLDCIAVGLEAADLLVYHELFKSKGESERADDARGYVNLVRLCHGVHAGFTGICHVAILERPLALLSQLKTEFGICEGPDEQDKPQNAMARMALEDLRCGASGSTNGTSCFRGVLVTVLALARNIIPVPGRRFVHDLDSTVAEAVAEAEIARRRKQANPAP